MWELSSIEYVIQPGDTLYSLAKKYNTTVEMIMNTNLALEPNNLRVGQKIYIFPNSNRTISNKRMPY